jgi:hypothetical protein
LGDDVGEAEKDLHASSVERFKQVVGKADDVF